jgi:hypothetical protein
VSAFYSTAEPATPVCPISISASTNRVSMMSNAIFVRFAIETLVSLVENSL